MRRLTAYTRYTPILKISYEIHEASLLESMPLTRRTHMAFLHWIFLLVLHVAEGLVVNNAQTIALANTTVDISARTIASNSSLETAADSLWNSSAFSKSLNGSIIVTYRCDGDDFGYNILGDSCFDAITNSLLEWEDPTPKTWGPRHTRGQYDFLLPQRFISRECF